MVFAHVQFPPPPPPFLFLVPSAPTSVLGLCTVVVWAQPQCTNGQLTGYDLRFYQTNPDSATIVSNRSDEIFRIVKETDVPSDQRGSAYVQVSTTVHTYYQAGSKATNHVGMQLMYIYSYICICMDMCLILCP